METFTRLAINTRMLWRQPQFNCIMETLIVFNDRGGNHVTNALTINKSLVFHRYSLHCMVCPSQGGEGIFLKFFLGNVRWGGRWLGCGALGRIWHLVNMKIKVCWEWFGEVGVFCSREGVVEGSGLFKHFKQRQNILLRKWPLEIIIKLTLSLQSNLNWLGHNNKKCPPYIRYYTH